MTATDDDRRDALASARDASHLVCTSVTRALDLPTADDPRWPIYIERAVAQYGIAYLLLVLHRVDPDRADWASDQLLTAWQAGDSLSEWAGQWIQEIEAGKTPTLPLWDQGQRARPNTPERENPDGSRTITVKRCCNGCGRVLGNVTDQEIEVSVAGLPLPDVRAECGCGST